MNEKKSKIKSFRYYFDVLGLIFLGGIAILDKGYLSILISYLAIKIAECISIKKKKCI